MKNVWLQKNNSDRCIVFCNGWGMDGSPFAPISSAGYDVLMLYDYQGVELPPSFDQQIRRYKDRVLVAWSMGVWAGQQLFSDMDSCFSEKIAINGTLCPIHDRFGIPHDIAKGTLESWGKNSRQRFYRRMCRSKSLLEQFIRYQPQRTCENQKEELAELFEIAGCFKPADSIYNTILIARNDRIVPTENQLAFWENSDACLLDGSHFPFYSWSSWDNLLACINTSQVYTSPMCAK